MSGRWVFRKLCVGEKTREPIQGEFFATEAIRCPAEALVREAIQNSMDASTEHLVRVRITLCQDQHALPPARWQRWFGDALPHLEADGNGLRDFAGRDAPCPFLAMEDFNTTGLVGDPRQAFDEGTENPFFYFFRAEGKSSKSEGARGRWGVGKYVFPRSSQASCLMAFSIPQGEGRRPFLMGQAVLKSHVVSQEHYCPDGYFADSQGGQLAMPIADQDTLKAFVKDFGIKRTAEPGLSIVIPWVDPEFSVETLSEAVVRTYFFPVLTGQLEVEIGTPDAVVVVNADTMLQVLERMDDESAQDLKPLVELAAWAAFQPESKLFRLHACTNSRPAWVRELMPSETVEAMRLAVQSGDALGIRVPVVVRTRDGREQNSHFGVFVRRDGNEKGSPVFLREGVMISDVRAARSRGFRSLVVVEHRPLASLLGDAENPAHTQWQKDSSNFRGKYTNGPAYINFVTSSVRSILDLLRPPEQEEDVDLLADLFRLPTSDESAEETRKATGRKRSDQSSESQTPDPHVDPVRKRFTVERLADGFTVRSTDAPITLPAVLNVRVAYDVRRKSPWSRYSPHDFRLGAKGVGIGRTEGMTLEFQDLNSARLLVRERPFTLEVRGFDPRRDLLTDVKLLEGVDDPTL